MSDPTTPERAPEHVAANVPAHAHAQEPEQDRATLHRRRTVLDAYSGEHGVYGVVLTTALIAVAEHLDSDLEVLFFVWGTVVVFWFAHVYSAVVASRTTPEGHEVPLRRTIGRAFRHASGMVVAMLIPTVMLLLGVFGWVDEDLAYLLALASGVIVLGIIGFGNATRNRRRWPLRIVGALVTASLGLVVILLSILVH